MFVMSSMLFAHFVEYFFCVSICVHLTLTIDFATIQGAQEPSNSVKRCAQMPPVTVDILKATAGLAPTVRPKPPITERSQKGSLEHKRSKDPKVFMNQMQAQCF